MDYCPEEMRKFVDVLNKYLPNLLSLLSNNQNIDLTTVGIVTATHHTNKAGQYSALQHYILPDLYSYTVQLIPGPTPTYDES